MCSTITCWVCGTTSWAGCGDHVAEVTGSPLAGHQCRCTEPTGTPFGLVGMVRRRSNG